MSLKFLFSVFRSCRDKLDPIAVLLQPNPFRIHPRNQKLSEDPIKSIAIGFQREFRPSTSSVLPRHCRLHHFISASFHHHPTHPIPPDLAHHHLHIVAREEPNARREKAARASESICSEAREEAISAGFYDSFFPLL